MGLTPKIRKLCFAIIISVLFNLSRAWLFSNRNKVKSCSVLQLCPWKRWVVGTSSFFYVLSLCAQYFPLCTIIASRYGPHIELTFVVYAPSVVSDSISLDKPKSATLQTRISLTRMFRAARSWEHTQRCQHVTVRTTCLLRHSLLMHPTKSLSTSKLA